MIYEQPTELYHHGIKGQKWGVRRFQNEDGTLTEAGKERYRGESFRTIFKKKINLIKKLKNYMKLMTKEKNYIQICKRI